MLSSGFMTPIFQGYACRFATDLAGDSHVWFSLLLNSNSTVNAGIDKAFTVPANHAAIFSGQAQFGSHGDFSGNHDVTLCQLGFFPYSLLS
jgi:hypothetical protein